MHEIGEMQQTRNRQIGASESEDYTNGQQTLRTERQEERRAKKSEAGTCEEERVLGHLLIG